MARQSNINMRIQIAALVFLASLGMLSADQTIENVQQALKEQGFDYGAVPVQPGRSFIGTPYETASPEVQRDVVISAQRVLARRGLYRGEIDGLTGPNFEFSLRAYQSRVGLPVTGRLDLETLAALQLLSVSNELMVVPSPRFL